MAKVRLKFPWFGPDDVARRPRPGDDVFDIPDEWKDDIPSTAELVESEEVIEGDVTGDGAVDDSDVAAMLEAEKQKQASANKARNAHNDQAAKDNAAAAAARAKKRVAKKRVAKK